MSRALAALADLICSQRPAASEACCRRSCRTPPAAARQRQLHCAAHAQCSPESTATAYGHNKPKRRGLLLSGLLMAGSAARAALLPPSSQAADAAAGPAAPSSSSGANQALAAEGELVAFSNPSQGYSLLRPAGWEQVKKAGADSLFRDPAQKSTTVGVTAYPVMIASLEQFGDLQAVGERLLGAERAKDSTLAVAMVSQSTRRGADGNQIYDFEYELESTRGRKRIMSTVTVYDKKLFIANGNVSCGKADSCSAIEQQLPLVRRVTNSLAVGGGIN